MREVGGFMVLPLVSFTQTMAVNNPVESHGVIGHYSPEQSLTVVQSPLFA